MPDVDKNALPALAEAFEQRRKELGLTLLEVVERAGLTRQGLLPVRRGELRHYNDRTIYGVRDALRWRDDWYEAIKAGATAEELVADDEPEPDPPPWELLLDQMRSVTEGLERLADLVEGLRETE